MDEVSLSISFDLVLGVLEFSIIFISMQVITKVNFDVNSKVIREGCYTYCICGKITLSSERKETI